MSHFSQESSTFQLDSSGKKSRSIYSCKAAKRRNRRWSRLSESAAQNIYPYACNANQKSDPDAICYEDNNANAV